MKHQRLIFYNPLSNEGKAKRDWEMLVKKHPDLAQSAYSLFSIENLVQFLKDVDPEVVVVAGGDGSINIVCNAVMQLKKKPMVAIIPLGFGNALAYCFGVETIEKALGVLKKSEHTMTIDVMKTNLPDNPLGLFNIGVGFDARIVHTRKNFRYIGFRSYLLSAFRSILFHPHSEITFTIDHSVTLSAMASSLMVANGPIIGQNYLVAPEAGLDDGLLDCTLFSTKYAYLTNLRLRGFKHPLYSLLGKVHFKASHIKIAGDPYVQIDGDSLEQPEGLEITIAKKQLTFLCNSEGIVQ